MELLNRMGYAFDDDSVIVTKYTGDEGIDGIIKEDKFGHRYINFLARLRDKADLMDYLSHLHLFKMTRSILRKNNYK